VARRLDVELTSTRGDGRFTWRAAGAKHPKGELDAGLVPEGVGVGDVVRVEAEADLEGLTVTTVFAPKGPRPEAERIELIGAQRSEPGVTAVLAAGRRNRKASAGQQGTRRRERERGAKPSKAVPRDRRQRRKQSPEEGRRRSRDRDSGRRGQPKASPGAPRLRARRTHRKAALAAIPEAQRELAEEVLRGGVPGVRDTIERMNAKADAEGIPKINGGPLVALAEQMAPKLRAAEWMDRAEAAEAGLETVDLRDLRSVVSAADSGARGKEAAALADRLRLGVAERVETEHRAWLNDLAGTISEERTVRALRLSSRPPKAGSPLPVDLSKRLADLASAGLTSEAGSKRWAMLLEAVAFSPVRTQVTAHGVPGEVGKELTDALRKLGSRVPQLSRLFDAEPKAGAKKGARRPAPPPPPPAAPTAAERKTAVAAKPDAAAAAAEDQPPREDSE